MEITAFRNKYRYDHVVMNTFEIKPGISVTRHRVDAIIIADVMQLVRKLKRDVQRVFISCK